jgi:Tfp pilus assembly protein PilF
MQDSLGRNSYSKEDAEYNKAMVKLNSAQRLFSRKRYADALREIDGAISSAPNIALSHSVKGSIHYMLKQNLEAKASWEKALELDPTQDNVRAILLRMY